MPFCGTAGHTLVGTERQIEALQQESHTFQDSPRCPQVLSNPPHAIDLLSSLCLSKRVPEAQGAQDRNVQVPILTRTYCLWGMRWGRAQLTYIDGKGEWGHIGCPVDPCIEASTFWEGGWCDSFLEKKHEGRQVSSRVGRRSRGLIVG